MKIGVYKVNRCPYVDLGNRVNSVNAIESEGGVSLINLVAWANGG